MRKRSDISGLMISFSFLAISDLIQVVVYFVLFIIRCWQGINFDDYNFYVCKFYTPCMMLGWRFSLMILILLTWIEFVHLFKYSTSKKAYISVNILLGCVFIISLCFSIAKSYLLKIIKYPAYMTDKGTFVLNTQCEINKALINYNIAVVVINVCFIIVGCLSCILQISLYSTRSSCVAIDRADLVYGATISLTVFAQILMTIPMVLSEAVRTLVSAKIAEGQSLTEIEDVSHFLLMLSKCGNGVLYEAFTISYLVANPEVLKKLKKKTKKPSMSEADENEEKFFESLSL